VFLLSSIWKRLSNGLIIAILLSAGLLGTAGTASAAGESYSWTDANDTAISASGGSYSAPVELKKGTPDAKGIPFSGNATVVCSPTTTAPAVITVYVKPTDYQKTTPTPGTFTVGPSCITASFDSSPSIAASTAISNTAKDSDVPGSCKGAFAWIACPFINSISKFVSDTAVNVITPFLQVNAVSQTSTPGLYQAWEGIKNFSEVIFIIIFLVIIFSTVIGTGLDQYSIKRMLPRVIAGAILVQFSFFFSGVIIDIGNILGSGVGDLITVATAGTPNTGANTAGLLVNIPTVIGGIVAGTAIWASLPLVLPTLGILLLSVLAVLFTFAARYIIIAVLIAVSPLAFVAWILPNTERYFKQWYTTFLRLILMYPIIVGLLTLGGRIGDILGSTSQVTTGGAAGLFVDILKPFIVVVTFLAIPRTFKWAGGAMSLAQGTFKGISHRGAKGIRESESYKRRKAETEGRRIDRMRKFSERSAVNRLTNTKAVGVFGRTQRALGTGMLSARALSVGGGPTTTKAIEQRYGKSFRSFDKELDELNEIKPSLFNEALTSHYGTGQAQKDARAKVLTEAPILMDYLRTSTGRAAILARSNAKNQFNGKNFRMIAENNPAELERMLRTAAKNNFRERINVFGSDFTSITGAGQAGNITAGEAFKAMAGGWKAKTIADDIDVSVFADATGADTGTKTAAGKTIYAPDTRSQSFATAIAEGSSPLAFAGAFDPKSRTPLDKGKKVQILQMIAQNKAIFDASAKSKALRNAILDEMKKSGNEEIYDEFLIDAMGQTSYIVQGWSDSQKQTEIERLLK
jgi:hypothetical protein